MTVATEILDFLDRGQQGISLTMLIENFPQFDPEDIKLGTRQLYNERKINRLSVKGNNDRSYYVFYSLYVRTVNTFSDYEQHVTLAPTLPPEPEPIPSPAYTPIPSPVWEPIPSVPEAPETPPAPVQAPVAPEVPLSPDEAVAVLEKAGWQAGPEIIERRVADRRTLTAMDVIDRWKLPYRLSRIIEIIATARKAKLDTKDAALVTALIRDHVQKENP